MKRKTKKTFHQVLCLILLFAIQSCYTEQQKHDMELIKMRAGADAAKLKNDVAIHKIRAERFERDGHAENAKDERQYQKESNEESKNKDVELKQATKFADCPIPFISCIDDSSK